MASGLNAGRNLSRGINDGAAQVWDFTPVIRQAQNMYAMEERKRQMAQKLYEDTVASYDPKKQKLRQADVPQYLNDYQEFANAKRTLLSGKIKDPIQVAQLNAVADKAAGKMQQRVAKSLQQEDFEKNMAQALWNNPDNFEDYTPEVLAAMRSNPVENIEANNLQGVDYNRVPLAGAPDVRNIGLYASKPFDPNKLSRWNETTKIKNVEYDGKGMVREKETETLKLGPDQIIKDAHTWFTSDRAAARSFAKEFKADQTNGTFEEVVQTFYEKYPEFKGKPIADPATYKAVKHLASVEPKLSVGKWEFTPQKKEQNATARQERYLALQNQYRKAYDEQQDIWIDRYIDDILPESSDEFFGAASIPLDPVVMEALGNPESASVNQDGNIALTYYLRDKSGKLVDAAGNQTTTPVVDARRAPVISKKQLKLAIRKAAPKDAGTTREMTRNKQAGTKSGSTESTSNTKKYKLSATGKNGQKAFSNDGENWFDANGNPIK